MSSEFVRNIKNTSLKEPLETNVQNDLISTPGDGSEVYVRNGETYDPISQSIIGIDSSDEDVLTINKTDKHHVTLKPNKDIVTKITSSDGALLHVEQTGHDVVLTPHASGDGGITEITSDNETLLTVENKAGKVTLSPKASGSNIDQYDFINSGNMHLGHDGGDVMPTPDKPTDLTPYINPNDPSELLLPFFVHYGGQSPTLLMDLQVPFNVEIYGHVDGKYKNILYKKSIEVTKSVVSAPVKYRGHPTDWVLKVVIDLDEFTSDIIGTLSITQNGHMVNPNSPEYYNHVHNIIIPKTTA